MGGSTAIVCVCFYTRLTHINICSMQERSMLFYRCNWMSIGSFLNKNLQLNVYRVLFKIRFWQVATFAALSLKEPR